MKKILIICLSVIFGVFINTKLSYSQPMGPNFERHEPMHGRYCLGSKWGWYGAKRIVSTLEDAKEVLLRFFAPYSDIKVGIIKERDSFFEAEITDEKGVVIDIVIVDKRSGRIRSIY